MAKPWPQPVSLTSDNLMNPFLPYVQSLKDSFTSAKSLQASGKKPLTNSSSKVLLFSPHPDDECIIGLLPLRLMNELGMEVINIPVTFGSDQMRQHARAQELADACAYLGWGLHQGRPDLNALEVADVVKLLSEHQPKVILFPHEKDWNSRHISTNQLLLAALAKMPADFSCLVVETEYWGAMDDPNLIVEGDVENVAALVAATSLHLGEVARNPYHLSLPFWMQDNVRRGSELVGGQGQTAPDFTFATLYRVRHWQQQKLAPYAIEQTAIPNGAEHLKQFFSWK